MPGSFGRPGFLGSIEKVYQNVIGRFLIRTKREEKIQIDSKTFPKK